MVRSLIAFDLQRLNLVHSGQFISNFLYDATLLRDAVTKGIAGLAKELLSLIFLAAVMIYQNWRLSLVSVVVLPVIGWVTRNLGNTMQKASTKAWWKPASFRPRLPKCSTAGASSKPTGWRRARWRASRPISTAG